MKRDISSYGSVIRHGAKLFKVLGWKRSLGVQGLGLLSSGLYAVGLASLVPVLGMLSGNPSTLPSTVGAVLSHLPMSLNADAILIFIMLAIFILRSLCLSLYYAYGGKVTESYTREIRNRLLAAYATSREQHGEENTKTRILYLNSQMPLLSSFNWGIVYCSLQFYTLIVLVVANIYFSPTAFLTSIAIGVIIIPLTQPLLRKVSRMGAALLVINQRALTQANNITEGFETVTTLNVRERLQQEVDNLGRDAMEKQFQLGIFQGIIAALPEILISLVILAFYFVLGPKGVNGPLIAIAGYSIVRLVGTIGQINERMGELMKLTWIPDELESFIRILTVSPEMRTVSTTGVEPLALKLNHVTVAFSDRPVVSDVSLEMLGARIYQLAGPNGSGKSTLLRTLAGLMPYKGSVMIGSSEVRTLNRASLTSMISYHGQENFLLEGTFLENVLLANPSRSAIDVQTLLIEMGLDTHPLFADGMDFPIQESSSNLSGGERQLICVLRTLLRDAPIYLFDEYTNHLSQSVTDKIGNYIRKLSDRIVVIISHSNLNLAEVVISMDHGQVASIEQRKPVSI